MANFCKNFLWTDAELSTVPSAYYAARFLTYMDVIFVERGQPPKAAPYLVKAARCPPPPYPPADPLAPSPLNAYPPSMAEERAHPYTHIGQMGSWQYPPPRG